MKIRPLILYLALLTASVCAEPTSNAILQQLEKKQPQYEVLAKKIFDYAELGFRETKSSQLLQNELKKEGFAVKAGVAGMPTAFVATYGQGEPVIGLLAEFDALPGLSQAAVAERKAVSTGEPGHACGHHLFGTASVAAGVSLKEWLQSSGRKGTVKVFGTPAEEGGSGKVYMAKAGIFDGTDIMLHWHPYDSNYSMWGNCLANRSAKFRFKGRASHAAIAPERGRSALDGVEAMNYMANLMREHLPSNARMHYVITHGGEAPNVVPESAEVYYFLRHPDGNTLKELWQRLELTARGAAQGTGTEVEIEIMHGIWGILPNQSLAKLIDKNLRSVGGVSYTEEEREFAREIQNTMEGKVPDLEQAQKIQPFEFATGMGSSDVGDVSWLVPTGGVWTACWVPGTSPHTWQAVAAGGTSIGNKGMMVAAKTLALTAQDIFKNPDLLNEINAEFSQARGKDYVYKSLMEDREPPLDE